MRTHAAQVLFSYYTISGEVHAALTKRAESILPQALTMPQFQMLDRLRWEDNEIVPIQLADEFSLTKGAITNLVKQLSRKGLIKQHANPNDGRSKHLRISNDGKRAHQECLIALSEMTTALLENFSVDELEMCSPVLKKLKDWLEIPV